MVVNGGDLLVIFTIITSTSLVRRRRNLSSIYKSVHRSVLNCVSEQSPSLVFVTRLTAMCLEEPSCGSCKLLLEAKQLNSTATMGAVLTS